MIYSFKLNLALLILASIVTTIYMSSTINTRKNQQPPTILNNPMSTCEFNSNVVNVPVPHWSKTKKSYRYGGFTSDMGWLLMVARYAIAKHEYMEFPSHWGHSEQNYYGWSDMFIPVVSPTCMKGTMSVKYLDQRNTTIRHDVKFKEYYTNYVTNHTYHPNEYIATRNGNKMTNDLGTMRQLFKWVFKVRPNIRKIIDQIKADVTRIDMQPYVSMHIRWGDKVGESKNKNDPVEGTKVPLEKYVKFLDRYPYDTVFVATDDVRSIGALKTLLGPNKQVLSMSQGRGFSISDYKPSLQKTLTLWAEMELLAEGQVFITNMESNVAKTVHLMMPHGTITHDVQNFFSCCDQGRRYNNCFWFCE